MNARRSSLKIETDGAVAKAVTNTVGPTATEATATDKQLAHLADLVPILLATDDLSLMQDLASLEAETKRLLALKPEALSAPRPVLTCVLEPNKVVAAVKANLCSPTNVRPPPPTSAFRFEHVGAKLQTLDGGLKVKHGDQAYHCFDDNGPDSVAACGPAAQAGATWKIRINGMHEARLDLGIFANMNRHTFQRPDSAYCFYGEGGMLSSEGGRGGQVRHQSTWTGFQEGDVCVFKLEARRLRMRCSRLGAAIFEIPLLDDTGDWYIFAKLYGRRGHNGQNSLFHAQTSGRRTKQNGIQEAGSFSEVELLPVSTDDVAGL